jgi:hypothetical protein
MCNEISSVGNKPGLQVAVTAALCLSSAMAMGADEPSVLNDPFIFSVGTYIVEADTDVQFNGKLGEIGTPIDWDRTFGGGSSTRIRVDGQWRFAERHKVRALWFDSDRSGSRTVDREIEWGGETFPVNTKIKGDLKYEIYELSYEYAFLRRDSYELSASIGAYYAQFDSNLSATISGPQGGTNQRNVSRDGGFDVPLPVLGLRAQWALPYDLSLDVSGQYFSASIDQYDGDLQQYRVTFSWQPMKWVGVGLGYDWFSANLDVDGTRFNGSADWTFSGPMAYYSVSF